jgi:hypothetical protein
MIYVIINNQSYMNFILHKTLYNFTLSLKQAIPRRLLDRQKPR